MRITFINEVADLCEQLGADVQKVAKGIGKDKRIGSKFLYAGPGYGGSCFPKDALALVKTAQGYDSPMRLIETTVAINETRKRARGRKVVAACDGRVRGKKIAILGLTFKPNTDDMRDAPSITVIQALRAGGAEIHAYDPEGMEASKGMLGQVTYREDPYEIAGNAGAIVIVTQWDEFRALDLKRLKTKLKTPTVIDLRNIYPVAEVKKHGFNYFAVGKKARVDFLS